MRTREIGLHAYLHAIDKDDTNQSQCNQGRQPVRRVLPVCRNWCEERHWMWAGTTACTDIKQVLSTSSMLGRAAKFMLSTGPLEQFQAVPFTVLHYTDC